MNSEEFVSMVKQVVEQNSVEDIIKNLSTLPLKGVNSRLEYLAEWYRELDTEGQECLKQIIIETSINTLFGFLCVLDGVRAIENGPDKGSLKLYYVKGSNQVLLNDFNEDFLHDIYKSLQE